MKSELIYRETKVIRMSRVPIYTAILCPVEFRIQNNKPRQYLCTCQAIRTWPKDKNVVKMVALSIFGAYWFYLKDCKLKRMIEIQGKVTTKMMKK